MSRDLWRQWDGQHDSDDQKKRAKRALDADNTPLSVDRDNCSGTFQGSHGRYETSLERCTCVDFVRRKLPCKHMYRLAIELELFGDKSKAKNDQYARKVPKSERNDMTIAVIAKLENYTDAEQMEIKSILLDDLFHQKPAKIYKDGTIVENAVADGLLVGTPNYEYFIRKMLKRDMLAAIKKQGDELPKSCKLVKDIAAWMIERKDTYGPMLFPNCMEVQLGYELKNVAMSAYKYLHRKFDEFAAADAVFDLETGTTQLIRKELPDDFETGLLNMFGTNPESK